MYFVALFVPYVFVHSLKPVCNWICFGNNPFFFVFVLTRSARQTKSGTFANSIDPDQTARNELSHQDLHWLAVLLFISISRSVRGGSAVFFFFFFFFCFLFFFLFFWGVFFACSSISAVLFDTEGSRSCCICWVLIIASFISVTCDLFVARNDLWTTSTRTEQIYILPIKKLRTIFVIPLG